MSNSEEEKYKISRDNIDRPELIKLIYKPKFLLAVVLIYAGLGIPFTEVTIQFNIFFRKIRSNDIRCHICFLRFNNINGGDKQD